MNKLPLLLAVLTLSLSAGASPASDDASNYTSWTNGSNQGTGFGAWDLTNNNNNGSTAFAGYFLGDSTAGAGNTNTGGQSFGVYANPGSAFATAQRSLGSVMSVGETFTVDLGVNFDNGNKGFNLRDGSNTNIFGLNIGGGAQINTAFTDNALLSTYNYGGNDAVLSLSLTLTTASELSYLVSRVSSQGTQGTLFSGSITGFTAAPANLELYISGTDDGSAQNNLYFNNLAVVPEPAMALLFLVGLGLIARMRK